MVEYMLSQIIEVSVAMSKELGMMRAYPIGWMLGFDPNLR